MKKRVNAKEEKKRWNDGESEYKKKEKKKWWTFDTGWSLDIYPSIFEKSLQIHCSFNFGVFSETPKCVSFGGSQSVSIWLFPGGPHEHGHTNWPKPAWSCILTSCSDMAGLSGGSLKKVLFGGRNAVFSVLWILETYSFVSSCD